MTEQTWKTDRGTIHYWVRNDLAGKPTLVFLPGLTADRRMFRDQINRFSGVYNTFAWDAPGHGLSRPFCLTFSLEGMAAWLHDILRTAHIERPILIGQSMGGCIAQCLIQRYPGTVGGFISIDSTPLKRRYLSTVEIQMLKQTELMYRAYPSWYMLVESSARGCAVTPWGQQMARDMMRGYTKESFCKLSGHGFHIIAQAIEADKPYHIDCPALLLCGENDRFGFTKRYNRSWSEGEHLPLIWIKNAGHNANTDQPQVVNKIIQDFLVENKLI